MPAPSAFQHWEGPPLEAWAPWTPHQVAARLANAGVAWCVIGGWAIDLFLGAQTREHEDIEIAIPRGDFSTLREHLAALRWFAIGGGSVRELAPGVHPPSDKHQNWVLDGSAWRLDVMLEPGDAGTWAYRRDATVRAPRQSMTGASANGIPYLRPQAVLLYKAKAVRPKDEADFAAVLPRLDGTARSWLHEALERRHPTHPWLAALRSAR